MSSDVHEDLHIDATSLAQALRLRVLNGALWFGVILGAPSVLLGIPDAIQYNAWATVISATFVYSLLVFLALARKLPYVFRAAVLQMSLLIMGVIALASIGYLAFPAMLLITQAVLATIFFGRRMMAFAISAGAGSFLVIGYLISTGTIQVETHEFYDVSSFRTWVLAIILFLFLCGVVVVSVERLVRTLEENFANRDRLVVRLQEQITARDEAEYGREQAEERMRHSQKIEALGRLAGGVAHDFNNTLTVILGHAEMLGRRLGHDPGALQLTLGIEDTARTASDLTRQLLTFAHRAPLQPRTIRAYQLVSDAVRVLRRVLPERVVLEVDVAESLPTVCVDRGEFQQALLNLAINACDAMPDGGRLIISAKNLEYSDHPPGTELSSGGYIEFCVEDTGQGMSKEVMDQAFEPFFTTKDEEHGTGLGLAAVDGFARASNGFAVLESEIGVGTRASIYLPVVEKDHKTPSMQEVPTPEYVANQETVLIAEDDATIRNIMQEILEEVGYQVLLAKDGVEAVEQVRSHQGNIDLVCTDAVMPGVDGGDLTACIREERPNTKILVCSGYVEPKALRPMIQSGEVAFLAKPFGRNDLLGAVHALLNGQPALDE